MSKKNTNKWKTVQISFIYYNMYVVFFTWLFLYKGPEMCDVFRQVSFLMIWCYYVAVLPPANCCIADRGLEYDTYALFGEHENPQ